MHEIGMKRRRLKHNDDDDDEDDLLKHLDVAFRREQWREKRIKAKVRKTLVHGRAYYNTTSSRSKLWTPLLPVSEEDQDRCLKELQSELGAQGLDECVCLVCDRLVLRRDSLRKEGSDWRFVVLLHECLGEPADDIPKTLASQYRAPPHVEGPENVMISPRGIHCYIDENDCPSAWISICKECDDSIRSHRLPKFAVANGFFIGRMPKCLRELTIPERFMTQLASIGAMTRVRRGGRHRCIRSHCVAFDCTPGPPVSLLPRSLAEVESYHVVMVGDFTEAQNSKVRKMHRIRNKVVRDLFSFY